MRLWRYERLVKRCESGYTEQGIHACTNKTKTLTKFGTCHSTSESKVGTKTSTRAHYTFTYIIQCKLYPNTFHTFDCARHFELGHEFKFNKRYIVLFRWLTMSIKNIVKFYCTNGRYHKIYQEMIC